MQTITYDAALSQFCDLAGLDPLTLSDIDKASINRLLNLWFKRGWEFYLWPQLIECGLRDANDGLIPYQQTGLHDIDTVVAIHEDNPSQNQNAREVQFRLLSIWIQIRDPQPAIRNQYWVTFRPPCPTLSNNSTLPAFLCAFTTHGAYTTWLRGEGQQGKAIAEAAEPWQWLYDEIDKIERQQSQNRRWRFRRN